MASGIRLTAVVLVVALVQLAVVISVAGSPRDAVVAVAAAAVLALALIRPTVVLILAPLATLFPQRVGPDAFDLSVTDAVAMVAIFVALPFVPWRNRNLQLVLVGLGVYLTLLLPSLIVNHDQRAMFEYFHRITLYGGSMIVGAAIVTAGVTRQALRLFVGVSAAVGALAVVDTVLDGLEPASVLGINKNHLGLVMGVAFLVLVCARSVIRWNPNAIAIAQILVLGGLLASQSRAAALATALALIVRPFLIRGSDRRRKVSIALAASALALVAISAISIQIRDLDRPAGELKFNTFNSRFTDLSEAIDEVFRPSPLTGGGLKYFNTPGAKRVAPHNLVVNELAESGVLGLVGATVLIGATIVALRRSRSEFAVLGLLVFGVRLLQGMADVYWVAGPLTIALIVAGMGLAEAPRGLQSPSRLSMKALAREPQRGESSDSR